MLLDGNQVISSFTKPNAPALNKAEQSTMALQAHMMAGMVGQNESQLGKSDFLMIRYAIGDAFVFPTGDKQRIFIICRSRPYDMDDFVKKVKELLAKKRLIR